MTSKLASAIPVALLLAGAPGASADEPAPVDIEATLQGIIATDPTPGLETPSIPASEDRVEYAPACGLGAVYVCYSTSACIEDGQEGVVYNGYLNGEVVTQTCVTETDPDVPVVTPPMVASAFRELSWPASELVVQPPGGRTLVNFATNFFTENTEPVRQSVTLLGQRVVIEATPETYSWRFGDGVVESTRSPGSAYPGLAVTHDYVRAERFGPRLDTTYRGRYQVNGGAWIGIPVTHTVPGAPVSLRVIEARPVLTGNYE
ncbi:MAG: hypothetical protein WB767_08335 [Nocardioides sp.]